MLWCSAARRPLWCHVRPFLSMPRRGISTDGGEALIEQPCWRRDAVAGGGGEGGWLCRGLWPVSHGPAQPDGGSGRRARTASAELGSWRCTHIQVNRSEAIRGTENPHLPPGGWAWVAKRTAVKCHSEGPHQRTDDQTRRWSDRRPHSADLPDTEMSARPVVLLPSSTYGPRPPACAEVPKAVRYDLLGASSARPVCACVHRSPPA